MPSDQQSQYQEEDCNLRETAAESIAFTAMYWLGLPSDDYSFAYLAAYTKDFTTLPEFHACLNTIQKTADSIIKQLEQKGIKSCKERTVTAHDEGTLDPPY